MKREMSARPADTDGRLYARLSKTKAGDWLEADAGFDCIRPGMKLKVQEDADGLFIACNSGQPSGVYSGQHYLDGQCDDGEHLIGLYPVPLASIETVSEIGASAGDK